MRRTGPMRGLVFFAALAVAALGLTGSAFAAAGWLGVYTQAVTTDLRDGMNLPGDGGVLVSGVVDDGPASRAGVRRGDVIVRFNSRTVNAPDDLVGLVRDAGEGRDVALEVIRNGDKRTLSVTLGHRPNDDSSRDEGDDDRSGMRAPAPPAAPEAPEAPAPPSDRIHRHVYRFEMNGDKLKEKDKDRSDDDGDDDGDDDDDKAAPKARVYTWHGKPGEMPDLRGLEGLKGLDGLKGLEGLQGLESLPGGGHMMMMNPGRGRLGVRIESLNDDLGAALGVPGGRGVLVVQVMDDTPAQKAGLKSGDVITAVEGRPVGDADDLVKALADESGRVTLSVVRRGEKRSIEAELESTSRGMRAWSNGSMGQGRSGEDKREVRVRVNEGSDRDELRKELDELRQQLRELRQQLEERRR